jgi:hypothetical protein
LTIDVLEVFHSRLQVEALVPPVFIVHSHAFPEFLAEITGGGRKESCHPFFPLIYGISLLSIRGQLFPLQYPKLEDLMRCAPIFVYLNQK